MSQTKSGAEKVCARRAGISLSEYQYHRLSGLKWCWKCREWSSIENYCRDKYRSDSVSSICKNCRLKHPDKSKSEIQKEIWVRRLAAGDYVHPMKGKRFPPEFSEKLRAAFKNKPRKSPMLGKNHSLETRKKISAILRERAIRGKACHSFKDGKLSERRGIRFSGEYKRWRFDVFIRDNFMCQMCREFRYGQLVAHHIKSFAGYPELRLNIENGVTVCRDCHYEIHGIEIKNE